MSRSAPPALVLLLARWLAEPAVARALALIACRALASGLRLGELRITALLLRRRVWPVLQDLDLALLLRKGLTRLSRLDLSAELVETVLRQLVAGLRAPAPRAALIEALCALDARERWLERPLSPDALEAVLLQLAALCEALAASPAHPQRQAAIAGWQTLFAQLEAGLAAAAEEGCTLGWLAAELAGYPQWLQRLQRQLRRGQRALRQDLACAEGRLPLLLARGLSGLGQALQAQPDYCAALDRALRAALCRLDRCLTHQLQRLYADWQHAWRQEASAAEQRQLDEALEALWGEALPWLLAVLPAELRSVLQPASVLTPAADSPH